MANNTDLPPTTLVVFGVTGDLSHRYILPALAVLDKASRLPANFKLIGLSRRQINTKDVLQEKTKNLSKYLEIIHMDVASDADYQNLRKHLPAAAQTIFYLSVPPAAVLPILKRLSASGLNHGNTKLLLEKPFGYDLDSARELTNETKKCFSEDQVYRIDHYLAKEMAQNIAVFLGSNALFRDVWNNKFIESIDVIAAENIGIEGRAGFYESTGALRDFVQSHLLQLAALTLMRPCSSLFEFEDMPKRRLEALVSLKPADPQLATRAQYDTYRQEVTNPGSNVETFASVKLFSNDPRWKDVPITLTTGKKLNTKTTEVRVRFKKTDASQANTLVLRIQPEEGVEIDLWAKKTGYEQELRNLPLTFSYADGSERLPDAYEQVLVDAMRSRLSLFASSNEILETWRILNPLLQNWAMSDAKLGTYKAGSSIEQIVRGD